eukprot:scaffold17073_cov25-Phaeocystis_antarctica.AAC.2
MPSASAGAGGWDTCSKRHAERYDAGAGPWHTLIRRRLRPGNYHVEVSQVVLVRRRADTWRWRARRVGA